MGVYGIANHEIVGAEYLQNLGFHGSTVPILVKRHVDAKRYLTYSQQGYYDKLSEASKQTLKHQGGPMSKEEAEKFEEDKLKPAILLMRTWDDKAKVKGMKVPEFDHYRELIFKCLE